MKKYLLSYPAVIIAFLSLIILSAFAPFQEKKPWNVPDAAKSMKNPVASNATSLASGKELWSTHCKSCHGAKGLGDGNKAAQLKTEPGDFTKTDIQAESDGALFYKLSEGRDEMPNFKKKLPDDEDRWALVNFIRTLKK